MNNFNKYLNRPKIALQVKDKYEKFGLKDNPFPFDPFLQPDSENIRTNGTIYCEPIKEREINLFKQQFFQQDLSGNHRRLGYLIDSSYTGRGNGKSALLVHLQKKINADFGYDLSGGVNRIFSLYVKPEPSGQTVRFWQLAVLLIDRLVKMTVLTDCLISLAYNYADQELGANLNGFLQTEEDFKKLIDYRFLKEIGLSEYSMKASVEQQLLAKGVDRDLARAILHNRFEPEKGLSDFLLSKNESVLKKEAPRLFFDQLVRIFIASGFNGCCIFFDEYEKMVDAQKQSERNDFAAELRHNLLEGGAQGPVLGFYMLVMAMHPGVPSLITESWEKSGINARCPLPGQASAVEQPHTIFFNNLHKENVRAMIGEYLGYFRVTSDIPEGVPLYPFTNEAVDYIAEAAAFNAAKSLKMAYSVLESLVSSDKDIIDEQFVKTLLESKSEPLSSDNETLDFLSKPASPLKGILSNHIRKDK